MDDYDCLDRIEDTIVNRKIARKAVNDLAARGNDLAGMLEAVEHLAEPFYLGLDADPDDSDMDVYP